MLNLFLIVAVISYFLGSIPFGYLLMKIFRGQDIRLSGSGNIGATNVARSGARGLGLATLLLDALKGATAVWIAKSLATSSLNGCVAAQATASTPCIPALRLMALAGLFAVFGHMFPVWLKFKGGKGVATALGVFAILFPKAVLISLAIFVIVLAASRFVSLGSILSAITFPVAAWFLYRPEWTSLAMVGCVAVLVVAKHHQNIRRLLAGNENRFGKGRGHGSGAKTSAEKQA
jgi:glycerol-3-phosphate acyltransferase PlsY